MKIAVIGDLGIDYYENLDILKPGGIAFNFAYNLKKSGVENVSLISVLGNDEFSKKLFVILRKTGVNINYLQKLSGKVPKQNIFLKEGERKFTGYDPGVLGKWKLRKKDLKFIKKHDAVFVPLSDGMEQIFNAVKKINGPMKAVDFSQDYEFADFDKMDNVIIKNSKFFDIIFIGGEKKYIPMVKKLVGKFPKKVFVLTLGKEGSIAFYMNTKYVQFAKRVKIIDTTGCGDAFQAGFLYSWLTKKDIKTALKAGTVQAMANIKIVGSTPLELK